MKVIIQFASCGQIAAKAEAKAKIAALLESGIEPDSEEITGLKPVADQRITRWLRG